MQILQAGLLWLPEFERLKCTGQCPAGRVAARSLTQAGIRKMKAGESRADGALPVGYGRLVMTCKMRRGPLRRTWSFRVRRAEQSTIKDIP